VIEIVRIPALDDNYIWLMHDPQSEETVVIDPAVAAPVLERAAARGWRITQIWNTHWHPDHVDGNANIKAATGAIITGPAGERSKIPTLDRTVNEGDKVSIGKTEAQVMSTPGHTDGHIVYYLPSVPAVFVGDVLFAMGCGRLFEGVPEQMFGNMRRLADLPLETKVYCAHEYTQANARFARQAEPDNEAVVDRLARVEAARQRFEPTVPTTIAEERATNPFMRAATLEQFTERRLARDNFRA